MSRGQKEGEVSDTGLVKNMLAHLKTTLDNKIANVQKEHQIEFEEFSTKLQQNTDSSIELEKNLETSTK